jgi:hypothetical protein
MGQVRPAMPCDAGPHRVGCSKIPSMRDTPSAEGASGPTCRACSPASQLDSTDDSSWFVGNSYLGITSE